jgi:hypothetical protein
MRCRLGLESMGFLVAYWKSLASMRSHCCVNEGEICVYKVLAFSDLLCLCIVISLFNIKVWCYNSTIMKVNATLTLLLLGLAAASPAFEPNGEDSLQGMSHYLIQDISITLLHRACTMLWKTLSPRPQETKWLLQGC